MTKEYDVIIIGAGAAGLMCASTAAKKGRKTLVIDSGKKPGRKILISGGGRCNFTNMEVTASNYVCQNPHFVKSALSQYTNWDFISLVCEYGIDYEERDHGQLFCLDSAKDIVNLLLSECQKGGVEYQYQAQVTDIEKQDQGFSLYSNGKKLTTESLVIATGGLSMPKLGATPFGYQVAEDFGLKRVPTCAGLVPFTLHSQDKEDFAELSGIALPSVITAQNGTSFSEALLFTHRGISGPAVLQISSFWQPGEALDINLSPQQDLNDLIQNVKAAHPNQSLKNTLAKVFPKRLVEIFMRRNQVEDKPLKQYHDKQIQEIADIFHHWQLKPNGTEGYRTAEVTLGGVDTDELSSKTMEAKNVPGLYFVGEVMDVSGWLGGYNFQWAWSSGYVAGMWV